MRVLMVGDIVGQPGRRTLRKLLPGLREEYGIDAVVVNGENAAGGFGLTLPTAQEILAAGVDVITSGNHIWDKREFYPHLDSELPVLRPVNYPRGVPGRGYLWINGLWVVNAIGQTWMGSFESPFFTMDKVLKDLNAQGQAIVVDFHAEASSEKNALGWYLDGRVSAVVGTHTHVGTIDTRILPKGTAYVSDLGMTGVIDSIIGDTPESVLKRFLTAIPSPLEVGNGRTKLNAVLIDIDESTGLARSIQRVDRETD